jgi:tetratricopeptide (TPR) repeat protein
MEDGSALPHPRRSDEARSSPGAQASASDALGDRMASALSGDRVAVLVGHLAPLTASGSLDWIAELATLAGQYGLAVPEIRAAVTDLAWLARMNGQRYPDRADWDAARGVTGSPTKRLVLAYAHAQRLRFDFKFAQLRTSCNEWLAEFSGDALILSLAAFAGLGARASNGMDLLTRAVESPDADEKSRQVCLAAIGFADHVEGQAETLLSLSNDMMARGEDNENVHYRRAAALRKLGRYDEALAEADRAMDLLDAAGSTLVQEQYSQERRAIIAAQDMRQQAETMTRELGDQISAQVDKRIAEASADLEDKITEASERLAERVDAAQELVSEGLLKMVEILGLFVTLLGFIVGSGAVVIKAKTFPERATAMALVVVGAVVFFGMLRLITGFRRKRHPF